MDYINSSNVGNGLFYGAKIYILWILSGILIVISLFLGILLVGISFGGIFSGDTSTMLFSLLAAFFIVYCLQGIYNFVGNMLSPQPFLNSLKNNHIPKNTKNTKNTKKINRGVKRLIKNKNN